MHLAHIERSHKMSQQIRSYSELIKLPTFLERYRYLKLSGTVGEETFGWERYLNQKFYTSLEWRRFRDSIIVRDNGCDLADPDHPFAPGEKIYIHHMNPIDVKDIVDQTEFLMNPEYVICCRNLTHNAIHYGDESLIMASEWTPRRPNDTCPWKE